jgi:diguanylate cyclase (GGDEF)-like protein
VPLRNVLQENLQDALRQLRQAANNHEQWHKDILRTLICRLPHDGRDIADNAYRLCRFGQWYYGNTSAELRNHREFAAIESEHMRMHQLATGLLHSAEKNMPITREEYDKFADALDHLRLETGTLIGKIENTIYHHDPLTGAENRLGMFSMLTEQHELIRRRVLDCCIAMMDLDHFKAVNDTYGHLTGDHVLAASVQHVIRHLRPYDKVFRYGGEEFLICLPNTDLRNGLAVIERIRGGLAATALAHEGSHPIFVSVSCGVALLDADAGIEESIHRADRAMYAAKQSGRNCTHVWKPAMGPDSAP